MKTKTIGQCKDCEWWINSSIRFDWKFHGYCKRLKTPANYIIVYKYYLNEKIRSKLRSKLMFDENFGCIYWKRKKML